jgi:threonine dehydrogenase-like Zn-dependent dehydrogenase
LKAVLKEEPKPGIAVCDVPVPQIKPGWTLLKIKACGICGSDVHIYEWTPGYEMLIPYMPCILGHEFSGEVIMVGKGTTDIQKEDRVFMGPSRVYRTRQKRKIPKRYGPFASGGMAEYALVPTDMLWKLPKTVSYQVGAMVEPLHVAMQAVFLSNIMSGEKAVILGPGPIGLFTLLSLKAAGVFVIMIGKAVDEHRLKLAKTLGADVVLNADEVDPTASVLEVSREGVDAVFEATGVPATIQQGLNMVKKNGKVIAIGIHPTSARINMLDLVRSSKHLIGSYGGPLSVWIRELALLAQGVINPKPIVSHKLSLDEAEKGFEHCIKKTGIKILLTT